MDRAGVFACGAVQPGQHEPQIGLRWGEAVDGVEVSLRAVGASGQLELGSGQVSLEVMRLKSDGRVEIRERRLRLGAAPVREAALVPAVGACRVVLAGRPGNRPVWLASGGLTCGKLPACL